MEREGLPIRKVDVDQERALAQKYNVQSIPTFLLIVDGEVVTRIVGQTSEAELRRLVAQIPADVPKPREEPPVIADAEDQTEETTTQPPRREAVIPPVGQARVAPPQEDKPGLLDRFLPNRNAEPPTIRGSDAELGVVETAPVNDPMAASVRIRVTIGGRINLGSGTVVDSRSGRTLIVTCGHIFRDMDDSTKVEVDLFASGAPRTYVGTVYSYDYDADVGLISVPTDTAVASVPMAPVQLALKQGDRVACIGCSGGNDPSREQLTVTAINKYDGPDNIECTGTPVQGRSGGGLFNTSGELVGVCIAADQKADLGLYAHAFAIHRLLDECKLTYLYRTPESPATAEAELLAEATEAPPSEPAIESPFAAYAAPEATPVSSTSVEDVSMEGAIADVAAGDAEVVVIIRPRNQPNVPSRVVVINQPSSKFYSYLNGELHPSQPSQSLTARRLQATTQTVPAPRAEQQSPAVERSTDAPTRKESLRPTSLSRDAGPQPYVRTVR
jgi:S1-C subfamily serine protease